MNYMQVGRELLKNGWKLKNKLNKVVTYVSHKSCKFNNISPNPLNGIQEVSGSIPLSSTPSVKQFVEERRGVNSPLFLSFDL